MKTIVASLLAVSVGVASAQLNPVEDTVEAAVAGDSADASADAVFDLEATFTIVRALVAADREKYIAAHLELTTEEQVGFWPLYDEYLIELNELNGRLANLLSEHAAAWDEVPDQLALDMIDEYFDMESDRIDLRRRSIRRFDEVLSPQKLARLVQLENRFNVLVALELANSVPLVQ